MRRANTRGGTFPKLLCGRSSLYSSLHASIFTRASNKFPNQLAFKHSSRCFPWKLSTCAFFTGRPGSMCTNSIFRSSAHARICRDVNSGPLSHRIASGAPRSATIRFQLPRHSPARKARLHFQGQTFPRVHVNHAQHAKLHPTIRRIVHKIQCPRMTFVLNREGVMYQKDFGAQAGDVVGSIKSYNPDKDWDYVE